MAIRGGFVVEADGSFNGNFIVDTQKYGTTIITARNQEGVFATTTFIIKPRIIELNPNRGPAFIASFTVDTQPSGGTIITATDELPEFATTIFEIFSSYIKLAGD